MAPLITLYLLNWLVLIAGFLFGLVRKRIHTIFWLSLLAFHAVSLFGVTELLQNYSTSTLVYGQGLMLLANSLFFLLTTALDDLVIQKRMRVERKEADRDEDRGTNRYIYCVLILMVVSFAIRLRGGVSVLHMSWEEIRESSGVLDSVATMLGFISAPVLWIIMKRRNYILIVLFGLLFFLQVQISGSRAMLLVFGCAILIDLVLSSYSYRKKIGLLVSFGAVVFLLHTALRLTRGISLAGLIVALSTGYHGLSVEGVDFTGGESKIYSYYYYVVEKDFQEYPYRSAVTLKRLGLLYLVTDLFPDIKPADMTYQLWKDWINEDDFLSRLYQSLEVPGSLHPTIWGDAYMNAGVTGIILYPLLFGFAVVGLEYFLAALSSVGHQATASIAGVGYMMIGRGNVVIGSGYIGYLFPMILLIMFLLRIKIFRKPSVGFGWRTA